MGHLLTDEAFPSFPSLPGEIETRGGEGSGMGRGETRHSAAADGRTGTSFNHTNMSSDRHILEKTPFRL